MRNSTNNGPTLDISEEAWEDISEDLDRSYLLAPLQINGRHFHVEAIEVEQREYSDFSDQIAVNIRKDKALRTFHAAAGANGPFQTFDIRGREYVVFVTPFCV